MLGPLIALKGYAGRLIAPNGYIGPDTFHRECSFSDSSQWAGRS